MKILLVQLMKIDNMKITIPKGYTINQAIEDCRKLFDVSTPKTDFSDVVSDRESTEEYEVEFKDNQEADEEFKDMSAYELKKKGVEGITLLERLVLEMEYFKKTGNHLDVSNNTFCSGSRGSDGDVPYVGWSPYNRKVYIGWYSFDSFYYSLRTRAVVSLTSKTSLPLNLEEAIKLVKKEGYVIYKPI